MQGSLTKHQRDILTGLLLGDGSLEFNGFKGSRLQVKQSEPKKEYVLWLAEQFREFIKTPPKQRPDTNQWYFGTRYTEEFSRFRSIFYKERRKLVPHNIVKYFDSPMTLAIWYMDDGGLDYRPGYHYSFSMSTDAFTIDEVKILQEVLLARFGIATSIQALLSRKTRYTKLYIGKGGRDKFLEIISPHILNCFSYKLPQLTYPNLTPQRLNQSAIQNA